MEVINSSVISLCLITEVILGSVCPSIHADDTINTTVSIRPVREQQVFMISVVELGS